MYRYVLYHDKAEVSYAAYKRYGFVNAYISDGFLDGGEASELGVYDDLDTALKDLEQYKCTAVKGSGTAGVPFMYGDVYCVFGEEYNEQDGKWQFSSDYELWFAVEDIKEE